MCKIYALRSVQDAFHPMDFQTPSRFLLISAISSLLGGQAVFNGQAIGWASVNSTASSTYSLQYYPQVDFSTTMISFSAAPGISWNSADENAVVVKPYRAWGRLLLDPWEIKAGLQKINFGPAKLLRSLRWFDQLDPRDPTQLTTGVWGINARYRSLSNRALWLWALAGNQDRKGNEVISNWTKAPEFGGRWEMPLGSAEGGLAVHYRNTKDAGHHELRVGSDGYWEPGPGLWYELSAGFFTGPTPLDNRLIYLTLGTDYTIPAGNGIYLSAESMLINAGFEDATAESRFTGIMASYSLSIFDRLTALAFGNFENNLYYSFLAWQRTYDNWSFQMSWFTAGGGSINAISGTDQFSGGNGMQLLVTFNH